MSSKLKLFTYISNKKKDCLLAKLCIKTWQKFLASDFEIIVLDEENLSLYVDSELVKKCSKLSDNLYSQIVALSALYFNGGIFLAPSVISTKRVDGLCELLHQHSLCVFGRSQLVLTSGFMMAKKQESLLKEIIEKICRYEYVDKFDMNTNAPYNIFQGVLREVPREKVLVLDDEKFGYLMEKTLFGVSGRYIFENCYFTNAVSVDEFLQNSCGLTYLNLDYVPPKFIKMQESEFLLSDLMLPKLFNKLLSL